MLGVEGPIRSRTFWISFLMSAKDLEAAFVEDEVSVSTSMTHINNLCPTNCVGTHIYEPVLVKIQNAHSHPCSLWYYHQW
jgi:hypothetical protein